VQNTSIWPLIVLLGLVTCLLAPTPGWPIGEVDPADINPLANLLGEILAVPLARMLAALCCVLAILALARGHGGACLLLVVLAGLILVGPTVMKAVVERAATAVQG
jgi:hypothetical protein